jgi:hypothetical protein
MMLVLVPSAATATEGASPRVQGIVEGLSCVPGQCLATGSTGKQVGLREWTLSGGRWSISSIPIEASSVAALSTVSCWAKDACIGVGSKGQIDTATGLALERSSGSWRAMPLPTGIYSLLSVSCTGPTLCVAIGWGTRGSNDLAVEWNGTSWREVPLATAAYSTSLYAVSCTSSSFCMAVGTGESSPFAEEWNGTDWRVTTTPNPPGGTETSGLSSVSCTSENFCLAVGVVSSCCGAYGGLASAWDGTSWSNVPTNLTQVQLNSVACATPTSCLAAGGSGPSDLEPLPFRAVIARWTGAALNAVPLRAIGQASSLDGVACTVPAWCSAVGWFRTRDGYQPLAERWNGSSLARMWVPVKP